MSSIKEDLKEAHKLVTDKYKKKIKNIDELPENAKKELDKIVKNDPSHTFENAKDALKGAVEGKLPVQMKDGKFMPIEMKVILKFDIEKQMKKNIVGGKVI